VRHDVKGLTIVIFSDESSHVIGIVFGQTFLFGQAYGGERASATEALVCSYRRSFDVGSELAGARDGAAYISAKRVIERDADGGVICVITQATFGDAAGGGFFEKHGVGADLQAIGRPSGRGIVGRAMGPAAFVFVGDPMSITSAQGIDFAVKSQRFAFQDEPLGGSVGFFFLDFFVQGAPGVDASVGDADLFDFFQVKQAFAIGEGVQGHDAQRTIVFGCIHDDKPPPEATQSHEGVMPNVLRFYLGTPVNGKMSKESGSNAGSGRCVILSWAGWGSSGARTVALRTTGSPDKPDVNQRKCAAGLTNQPTSSRACHERPSHTQNVETAWDC